MQYFEISALDVAQVNDVIQSSIQEICKKISSGHYGTFNIKQWERHGIRTLGDQSKIDLSGIIDYDHHQTLPDTPIIAKPKMPIIGEEEADQEEDEDENGQEEKPQEEEPIQERKDEREQEEDSKVEVKLKEEPSQERVEVKERKEKEKVIEPQPLKSSEAQAIPKEVPKGSQQQVT